MLLPKLIIFGLFLSACNPVTVTPKADATKDTYFPISIGPQLAYLQLALNDEERSRGLMYREKLKPHHGMLFIFETPRQQHFWMRNTEIALDVGYYDASGQLKEICKLYPYDETSVSSHRDDIKFAIEMNQNWYEYNGIGIDAQIDREALLEAISKRGIEPSLLRL
jgi:uncharacterized membrane protein (UPF0127 family)